MRIWYDNYDLWCWECGNRREVGFYTREAAERNLSRHQGIKALASIVVDAAVNTLAQRARQ